MTFKAGKLYQSNAAPQPPVRGLPQTWGYYAGTDNIATVEAADYFNLQANQIIGRNTTWFVGDLIFCVCADGVVQLSITAVSPNVATSNFSPVVGANSVNTAAIQANAVTLATLSTGVAPQAVIKYSAKYTTVGGAAAEVITIAGALATDLAFVQLNAPGTNTVSVKDAVMTANTLTVTFSADPGNNAIIYYQVVRAAS